MQPLTIQYRERKRPADAPRQSLAGGPVRVCFLIDELATAGTETQLLALIRHLDRSRVQPYLCLLRGDNPLSQSLEPADCPVLRLRIGSLRHPRTVLRGVQFLRFLRHQRIEVLQAYFPDSSYFGVPLAWLAQVPCRLRTRNNLGHWITPVHRLLGRALNVFTTATIANCQAARQALLTDEAPRPETVRVLENGVDLGRFEDVPAVATGPQGTRRVGIVANLRPVKGLDVLLRAAVQLTQRHPQLVFEVAGEGEMRPVLEEEIGRCGLAGRFLLRGPVSDVPAFLARLDVAVLCSHAEGMSNAVLEYMAAARPIVATAVGATPELIVEGEHGLLVPPGDPQALAQGINRLLEEPVLARRLGDAARERAFGQYSRQAMVQRFEDLYKGLRR